MKYFIFLSYYLLIIFTIGGCSNTHASTSRSGSEPVATKSNCYIVFDAGSSGTRLLIYQQLDGNWQQHKGTKASALADPIRGIRGKSTENIAATVEEITATLETVKDVFPWHQQCELQAALVYATGGMRITEQQNLTASRDLWRLLHSALKEALPPKTAIETRTLTGYEEGLFAWLSAVQKTGDANIGIVEMGGASSQIAFPCDTCVNDNNAVANVKVEGRIRTIYSHSFLGLGLDEAPKTLGQPQACSYAIGQSQPNWSPAMCLDKISIQQNNRMIDPYHMNGHQGTTPSVPTEKANVNAWYTTGAFNYMDPDNIDSCCRNRGKCYKPETACFRELYMTKYLNVLGIPKTYKKLDVSWTLGAVLCHSNACLPDTSQLQCRWLDSQCFDYEQPDNETTTPSDSTKSKSANITALPPNGFLTLTP